MSENKITETDKAEENGAAEIAPAHQQLVNNGEAAQTPPTQVAVTTATVKIEGQEFPLDIAIASDDNLLKIALSPHYPSIKNAVVSREIRLGEMIVSIVKRAEHKGRSEYCDDKNRKTKPSSFKHNRYTTAAAY